MGHVVTLDTIDPTQVNVVGGKGAHLAGLTRIDGVRVPNAFCVTTDAFRKMVGETPSIAEACERLADVEPSARNAIREASSHVREQFEQINLPTEIVTAIGAELVRLGGDLAYAVRSSATAEDSPNASFAGQHDSYLNVVGHAAICSHVIRCWASLFTERAVTYRLHNGIPHDAVQMAVIVQQMISPVASGVVFTADPMTSNRTVAAVEAVFGPGEALVSGRAEPATYTVRDREIIGRSVATRAELTDAQVVELTDLARRIEAHFGHPQDIEWCLDEDGFHIVQSRPITTLFPVPPTTDGGPHVYLSVGHQQMMTDPIKPLGLSVWHLTTRAVMCEAGGRLFVDVTATLASPARRAGLLGLMDKADPLFRDALQTVIDRDFVPTLPDDATAAPATRDVAAPIETDPAIVTELIAEREASLAALKRDIGTLSGPPLFEFLLDAFEEDKRILFEPRSHEVIMAGMEATWWLNDHLQEWLGETNAADTLTQSAPNNVTSEMGLALLDVADVIRPRPDVVAFLERVEQTGDDGLVDGLAARAGGAEAAAAVRTYLDRYGMRCAGEIDITRPRWSEQPATLVPTVLSNIRNFGPGAGPRRFELGRQHADAKKEELLARVRVLPDGERKANEVARMIERVRTFVGYREYPKYHKICRAFVYKQALLGEADRLVRAGALREREDIFYLRFDELQEVARTHRADDELIRRRQDAFASYGALRPPRVLTSDGEAITGDYRRHDTPAGALAGMAASAGTVEGRARVIADLAHADLEPGDILVTTYTDPSWTPLFVAVQAMVTEVGGLMTHGAVIAREYGLPAVVGVTDATRLIQDGQRIRVHGGAGYVEILS